MQCATWHIACCRRVKTQCAARHIEGIAGAEGIRRMADAAIVDVLRGKVPAGETVTVKGWVRTRRDSKGGFSFLAVHDGSCFDAIQVVAPGTLENYASEVMHLTAGCSVICSGVLAQSQGKGQSFEVQATGVEGGRAGWTIPDTYPISPKQHTLRIPARGRAPAAAHEHDRRGDARAPHAEPGGAPVLPRARLLLDPHADHHGLRRRGRRADVPRVDARPGEPAAHAGREGGFLAGFLRQGARA